MIWLLACLAALTPFLWRHIVVTGVSAVGVLLVIGGAVLVGCFLFLFGSMLVATLT